MKLYIESESDTAYVQTFMFHKGEQEAVLVPANGDKMLGAVFPVIPITINVMSEKSIKCTSL